MKTEAHEEIKELNLAYLMLAQQLIRQDRAGAIYRLGISDDIADLIVDTRPGTQDGSVKHAAVSLPLRGSHAAGFVVQP